MSGIHASQMHASASTRSCKCWQMVCGRQKQGVPGMGIGLGIGRSAGRAWWSMTILRGWRRLMMTPGLFLIKPGIVRKSGIFHQNIERILTIKNELGNMGKNQIF